MLEQKKQFWVIVSIIFFGFVGVSMPYLIFPSLFLDAERAILADELSKSNQLIFLGVTLAAYPLGQFFGSPILGSLSDEYGRKRLLEATLLVGAFCNLLTGFAIDWENLTLLILSRFFAGLMEGNIAIARAMAADLYLIPKHESFGKINASVSIAYLIGPLFGGLLTEDSFWEGLNFATPFYVICFLFLLLSLISALVLDKGFKSKPEHSRSFLERINIFKRMAHLFLNKRLKFLILASTVFTLAVDIFYEFGPVYLNLKWKFGPSDLIIYNAILCFALALGNGWLPRFFARDKRKTILISMGIFGLLLLVIITINSPWFMVLLFGLCGLVIGLAVTLITVKISDSAQETIQGEVLGVQLSLRVFGDALICLFGGFLLLLSPKLILLAAALMSFGIMFIYNFKRLGS